MVDVKNLKNGRKPVKLQKESLAGCAGKVNRVKEIRRRGKDGLKINRQQHFPFCEEESVTSVSVR